MELWALYVSGMNEYHAARSLQDAREKAHALNAAIIANTHKERPDLEPNVWATPSIWPFKADEHAEDLAKLDDARAAVAHPRAA